MDRRSIVGLGAVLAAAALMVGLALAARMGRDAPRTDALPLATEPPATVAPTATAPPTTPSPDATGPPPSITSHPVSAIPSRFRYAVLGWGPVTRIWLVDLQSQVAPRLVIRLEHMGNGEHTASSNGEVVVLSAPGGHGHRAVHVIRPTTGTRSIVHDEPDTQVAGTPVVTRAGDRYAFAKQLAGMSGAPGGRADLGMWVGRTSGGAPALVVSGGGAAPAVPLGWSPDGRWLAFVRAAEIFVLSPDGVERRVGSGVDASWLSNDVLLVARGVTSAPGIDRYDVGAGSTREELRTSAPVISVLADPTGRRYAYVERTGSEDLLTLGTVWLRDATGGAARKLGAERIHDLAWSSDGAALTGIPGGDDSNTGVRDLLGGPVIHLCVRSDALPPPPPGGCI
jgi:hypothetical protein